MKEILITCKEIWRGVKKKTERYEWTWWWSWVGPNGLKRIASTRTHIPSLKPSKNTKTPINTVQISAPITERGFTYSSFWTYFLSLAHSESMASVVLRNPNSKRIVPFSSQIYSCCRGSLSISDAFSANETSATRCGPSVNPWWRSMATFTRTCVLLLISTSLIFICLLISTVFCVLICIFFFQK